MKKGFWIFMGILLAIGIVAGAIYCRGKKPQEEEPDRTPPEEPAIFGEWAFTLEKDFLYYPTLKGSVYVEDYPTRLTLAFNGEEREIDLSDVDYNFVFIFNLDQVFLYDRIDAGEYDVMIYAYNGGEKKLLGEPQKIVIEHDFYCTSVGVGGEGVITGMDSEDFWTGNY